METSHEINEISAALAAAQGEIESAKKSAANPYFKSKYADLAEVWYAIREALSKNKLAVVQTPTSEYGDFVTRRVKVDKQGGGYDIREITEREAIVRVKTRLVHSSGQWLESELTMLPAKSDPQAIGSAITYARRYALASVVGVAQDDDDGNAASGKDTSTETKRAAAAAEKKSGQQRSKAETDKGGSESTAGKEPEGNGETGKESETKAMKFSEIKKIITPELKEAFVSRKTATCMIEEYFEAFAGDQTKIMEALKAADEEANNAA